MGKDGNPAMQTVECLAARSSLRAHPGVVDSIRRLAALYTLDDNKLVTYEAYVEMHTVYADDPRNAGDASSLTMPHLRAPDMTYTHPHPLYLRPSSASSRRSSSRSVWPAR